MAKVEIDESEWAAQQTVTKLFADMLNNPQAREQVLKAKKLARPNEPIPEIDAKEEGFKEIAALRKELSDFTQAQVKAREEEEARKKANEFQSTWENQKASLRADGWQDEGIDKIEKLAQERGIPDLEAAASLYEKLNPTPAPVQPSGYGRFNMFDMPGQEDPNSYMKKLLDGHGESESSLDGEIRAAINDVRGQSARRL